MEHKRPLVWLSADPRHETVMAQFLPDWQVRQLNMADTPLALKPDVTRRSIGVCDLGEETAKLETVEQWLEKLMLPGWLALVTPGQLDKPEVRSLIRRYCQDYHTLPADLQRLRHSLGHIWGMTRLSSAVVKEHSSSYQEFALEGSSPGISEARSLLRKFSVASDPLVICGEGGTGREAAARFAHDLSPRTLQAMVTVNCAALPASLTQSELFGHERGAFTHAMTSRKGRIELADQGTLLLIGVDELGLDQQSALLRFLQEGKIERIGATQAFDVDVRIIATCSHPLEQRVREGLFRSDVFYRLGNLNVTMPPLRARLEDLPTLVERLLESFAGKSHSMTREALMAIAGHPWPGNLRELENRVHQAVILSRQPEIEPADLGLQPGSFTHYQDELSLEAVRSRADQHAISVSLAITNHNISEAARLLRISRVSMYRLMERHRIRPSKPGTSGIDYRTGE
ncbi:sigma-54 dependent transcriptional regulator [Marinobacter pelagius]|uniref:DNA-binding transcriptional response regulator, NtrC family, contains REC, AAA-type ATPase, and a Fis-type DNA-binding domains n=1 Tax=Marinobacter pelagius TaxID=379482 RepID=A0A1I4WYZ4_9GAMM|nr:sigma-54 dependent transcriptional regulator [Marinobacter pelagius]SFN18625.1 DNA-binding transcriptional response regulator, NtrC family, contains REC, AAA-type ATPase, and a Fis-type DNA-binding domains [Marinobacter pelagius]